MEALDLQEMQIAQGALPYRKTVTDKSRRTYTSIETTREFVTGNLSIITITDGSRLTAYAYLKWQSDSLDIRDLHVVAQFRRRGLGDILLSRIVSWAQIAGIEEVWGGIVLEDINESPFLLDWYQRRGFKVEFPEAPGTRTSLPVENDYSVWLNVADWLEPSTAKNFQHEYQQSSKIRKITKGHSTQESLPNAINLHETDYERKTRLASDLIDRGVEAKRNKQYQEAERHYIEATELAPWYLHSYYALGKLNYLANKQEASLLNYTVATHLQLGLRPAQMLNEGIQRSTESTLSEYPVSLITQVRSLHPHADLLLCDNNTPRHLGHSLIDLSLSDNALPEIHQAAQAYRQSISGGFFAQMDIELDKGLYFLAGVSYLLQHIQWDRVGKYPAEDVYRLYSEPSAQSPADKASEAEFASVCTNLVQAIGLRPLQTATPFADLLGELQTIRDVMSDSTMVELKEYADQALQAAKKLLARPFHATMGALLLHSLNQSVVFRPLMINRWDDSTGLLLTTATDYLFYLSQEARKLGLRTPVLQSLTWSLKSRELIDLRNGLTHSCYSWNTGPNGQTLRIMDRYDLNSGHTVRSLDAATCEAFHGLMCICALALERHLA